jgi:hypothetical protein
VRYQCSRRLVAGDVHVTCSCYHRSCRAALAIIKKPRCGRRTLAGERELTAAPQMGHRDCIIRPEPGARGHERSAGCPEGRGTVSVVPPPNLNRSIGPDRVRSSPQLWLAEPPLAVPVGFAYLAYYCAVSSDPQNQMTAAMPGHRAAAMATVPPSGVRPQAAVSTGI